MAHIIRFILLLTAGTAFLWLAMCHHMVIAYLLISISVAGVIALAWWVTADIDHEA